MENFPELETLTEHESLHVAAIIVGLMELGEIDPHNGKSKQFVLLDSVEGSIHYFYYGNTPEDAPEKQESLETDEDDEAAAVVFSRSLLHPEQPYNTVVVTVDAEGTPEIHSITHSPLIPAQGMSDYCYDDQAFLHPEVIEDFLSDLDMASLSPASKADKERLERAVGLGTGVLNTPLRNLSDTEDHQRKETSLLLHEAYMPAFLSQITDIIDWIEGNPKKLLPGTSTEFGGDNLSGLIIPSPGQSLDGIHSALAIIFDQPGLLPNGPPIHSRLLFTVGRNGAAGFVAQKNDVEIINMGTNETTSSVKIQVDPQEQVLTVADARMILNIMKSMDSTD